MRAVVLTLALAVGVLAAATGVAHAYPQYQLSKEPTCATCHISPSGGGLLNDYGELTAEEESQWGGNPSFLHGAVELPDWLALGGDLRGAGGLHDNGNGAGPSAFPMQAELYAAASKGAVTLYATAGITLREDSPWPLSREHWLMWKPDEGGEGPYVRAGRIMPVFGLRQAEHPYYTRRYGPTPLFAEVYGVNGGWLSPKLEAHVTAFVHDPLVDGTQKGNGAAAYVEKRFGAAQLGAEAMYATSDDDGRLHAGVTGKLWLEGAKLLLSGEGMVVHQDFTSAGAPSRYQLVGQLIGTYFVRPGLFVDLGVGHFAEDTAIADTFRDAVDLNVHWFPLSHLELVLTSRFQRIGLGNGGDDSGFALLQVHYRI